jgi:hypothetical protein
LEIHLEMQHNNNYTHIPLLDDIYPQNSSGLGGDIPLVVCFTKANTETRENKDGKLLDNGKWVQTTMNILKVKEIADDCTHFGSVGALIWKLVRN